MKSVMNGEILELQDVVQREHVEYKGGTRLPFERSGHIGSGRTTEFKRLNCPIDQLEKPLISKLLPFVLGCLNARINGTIYFGIAGTTFFL